MTSERLIAIGASLGGLEALVRVLEPLPKELPVPIVIVQHRRGSDSELAKLLSARTGLEVVDAEAQSPVAAGRVVLAPGDYHLLVEGGVFELSLDAPVSFARPSIDVLFQSIADSRPGGAVGVLLTGASEDGARGLAMLAEQGAITVVQDPADAESPVAPAAALRMLTPAHVLSIGEIGALLSEIEGGSK